MDLLEKCPTVAGADWDLLIKARAEINSQYGDVAAQTIQKLLKQNPDLAEVYESLPTKGSIEHFVIRKIA